MTIMQKNAFLNLIKNLNAIAKKGKWQFFYDKGADSLYWSKKKISADSKLKKFSRETSFYVNGAGGVEGLMVQYFQNNFLTQNENLAKIGIVDSINKADNVERPISLGSKKDELEALFSASIKNDILTDALEANYTLRDLEKALRV
jgi:hypothetical protein